MRVLMDKMIAYKLSPEMKNMHEMCGSLLNIVMSGNWRKASTRKELKVIGSEVLGVKNEVV